MKSSDLTIGALPRVIRSNEQLRDLVYIPKSALIGIALQTIETYCSTYEANLDGFDGMNQDVVMIDTLNEYIDTYNAATLGAIVSTLTNMGYTSFDCDELATYPMERAKAVIFYAYYGELSRLTNEAAENLRQIDLVGASPVNVSDIGLVWGHPDVLDALNVDEGELGDFMANTIHTYFGLDNNWLNAACVRFLNRYAVNGGDLAAWNDDEDVSDMLLDFANEALNDVGSEGAFYGAFNAIVKTLHIDSIDDVKPSDVAALTVIESVLHLWLHKALHELCQAAADAITSEEQTKLPY